MMRLPKGTFFLISSSSFLLLATLLPFPILRTKPLNSPFFHYWCSIPIFSPLNVNLIPLIRIRSHRSFQPLSHTQRIFVYRIFVPIGSDQIEFGLDHHLQTVTLIIDQVSRHHSSAGPQSQGRRSSA